MASSASMMGLNPEQRRAVEHGEGPLLVIAGPGSGKTRVITERIVYLLEKGLRPENLLALTFTDKAAEEMKGRVQGALANLPSLPHISTFHAFCYHVLRRRHFERRLLDQVDLWIFLRRRMEKLGLEFYLKLAEPGAFLHDLNAFFSRCRDELVEPAEFEAYVERLEGELLRKKAALDPAERVADEEELRKKRELARVFRNSRRLVEEAGCSTLGSLISETLLLWEREPEVLEQWRARFRYVLVDEFQDTNYGQVELLRRLVVPPFNITAVGDDDQAIYRFRGAAHGAFEMFERVFPRAAKVYLHRNYRSPARVLRLADVVVAKNARVENKPHLETDKEEGCPVFLIESPDYKTEAAWIAAEVERLAAKGRRFGEIAILYRGHGYRDPLVEVFRCRRIPFTIRGLSILSTIIIRDLLAYLNLIHSPHDNISLTRVLLAPRWNFPEDLALALRKQAAKDRCSLFEALKAWERSLLKDDLERTGWPDLRAILGELRQVAEHSPVTVLFDRLMDRLELRFLPGESDAAIVSSFRTFLEKWEKKGETQKLREFMEYFRYFREAGGLIEAPERQDDADAVQMMTVHAAKGLEFPVVFILSVARQRFPHRQERPLIEFPDELRKGPRPPADIHLQEERRLFYVGMTRAKERLYISSVTRGKPSVFVEDLLSDAMVASRDIECIQVSGLSVEAISAVGGSSAEETASRNLLLDRARNSPARLFHIDTSPARATHPGLAEWASRPPSIEPGEKVRLSATAVEDYWGCPLKFKISHYLKVPTGPQAPLTFGNLMHQCVRHYFELRRKHLPCFEEIQEFYLGSWKGVGFEDQYQEETYRKTGLDQLREFVERHNERAVPADRIQLEQRFELDLDELVLEGRIDQITRLENHEVELVDYKTGRPRTQKDADRSLQLSIYALAAQRTLGVKPVRLTFYNLTNNQPVSTVRTARDLEEALEKIRETAENIRHLLFEPTPGFVCKRCNFVPICPAHEGSF